MLTGTHIAYYSICHRKLWLFSNGINMEHNSELVEQGKVIAETTYLDRARKYTELALDGIKIDFYDAENAVVHEVKKSDKVEKAHISQVKYYLYVLHKHGILEPSAILEYPKLKQREWVDWSDGIVDEVEGWIAESMIVMEMKDCPRAINKPLCKNCSYYELCYIDEE